MRKAHFTIFILSFVMLSAPAAQGISISQANDNFETGDLFTFSISGSGNFDDFQRTEIANATDGSWFRYEERSNSDVRTSEGGADVFIVKESPNLPAFIDPESGPFDTLLLIDSFGENVAPSFRDYYEKVYDSNANGGAGGWDNRTDTEDTSGSSDRGDDRGDVQPTVSNATYLIQFPEMSESSMNIFDDFWQLPGFGEAGFDGQIPRYLSMVVPESRTMTINGASQSLSVITVMSGFQVNFNNAYQTTIPIGDPNDPDTPFAPVDAFLDVQASMNFNHTFDSANGMLLEIVEYTSFNVILDYFNGSYTIPDAQYLGGPKTFSLDIMFDISSANSDVTTLTESSVYYGASRTASTGTARLQEGDAVIFDLDQRNSFRFETKESIGDPSTNGYMREERSEATSETDGDFIFDVYRHSPTMVESVIFMDGLRDTTFSGYFAETDRGNFFDDTYGDSTFAEEAKDVMQIQFGTSADKDILPFFDDNKRVNFDFLRNDDCSDCGDNFFPPIPDMMPKDGILNITNYHEDFSSDDFVKINTFDHTWFNVEQHRQDYSLTFSGTVDIPIYRGGPDPFWLTVTLSGQAKASQSFYYDADTGALLAVDEQSSFNLEVHGTDTMPYEGGFETVSFDATINADDSFLIVIKEHPSLYQAAQGVDPVDHSTEGTPSDNSTDPADPTDDDSSPPGLDLPVPFVPFVAALVAIPIVRKKFRN